jgi:hypothetical protein
LRLNACRERTVKPRSRSFNAGYRNAADAGYHNLAIRTERHEDCLHKSGVGFDIQERGK